MRLSFRPSATGGIATRSRGGRGYTQATFTPFGTERSATSMCQLAPRIITKVQHAALRRSDLPDTVREAPALLHEPQILDREPLQVWKDVIKLHRRNAEPRGKRR